VTLIALVVLYVAVAQGRHWLDSRAAPPKVWASGQVVRVIDGDTVDVQGAGRVRMLGIDAPETSNNSHGDKGCYGEAAKRRLAELLPSGTPVRLVAEKRAKDRYGRLLAYVEADGIDAGWQLMREGLTDFYRDKDKAIVPFGRQARYLDAWRAAEADVLGLHGPECRP